MKHALETPELSLGVAAFSVPQRDLINVEVELRRRKTPQAEAFFTAQGSEPFFVKNLENIQGDERDVIFICIPKKKENVMRTGIPAYVHQFAPRSRPQKQR